MSVMHDQGDLAPHEARDAVEFVALMRRLKERSGLTYRQLEERAAEHGDVLARSTLADALAGRTPPRKELLAAFVRACGDGDRGEEWLDAWARIVARRGAGAPQPHRRVRVRGRLTARTLAATAAAVALALTGVLAWTSFVEDKPATGQSDRSASASASSGTMAGPPSGWVRIHPVTAPGLCLTDGRVADRRYTPLVAVQRRCDEVAPQGTLLEPLSGDEYRIQWHHPDYGKGCLKAWSEGPANGLLEPMDDCRLGSRFHIEPSGTYGSGRYVLRIAGQGCAGIKGSDTSEGTEAVMGRCVGKGGQVFFIEPAS